MSLHDDPNDYEPMSSIDDDLLMLRANGSNLSIDPELYVMYETDEEKACEDVQRMAAAMAPQVAELEDVLRDMLDNNDASNGSENNTNMSFISDDDDANWDDDFHDELEQLAHSEQLLREELEFAHSFSNLMGPVTPQKVGQDPPAYVAKTPSRHMTNPPEQQEQHTPRTPANTTPQTSSSRLSWTPFSGSKRKSGNNGLRTPGGSLYSLQEHADHLQLKTERFGWYYCDQTKYIMGKSYNAGAADFQTSSEFLVSKQQLEYSPYRHEQEVLPGLQVEQQHADSQADVDPTQALHDATTVGLVKDYCIPIPFRKIKRLYCGIVHHNVHPNMTASNVVESSRPEESARQPATPPRSTTKTQLTTETSTPDPLTPQPPTSTPAPEVTPASIAASKSPGTPLPHQQHHQEEPLPIRTVAFRIRPDVLCGSVMGAVSAALEDVSSTSASPTEQPKNFTSHIIMKRQGGHLRGAVAVETTHPEIGNRRNAKATPGNSAKTIMAYVVDAQLCTLKGDSLERRLLVRFYHIQDDPEAHSELGHHIFLVQQERRREDKERQNEQEQQTNITTTTADESISIDDDFRSSDNDAANLHLKQSCSLIQRLMFAQHAAKSSGTPYNNHDTNWVGFKDVAFGTREAMQAAIGTHLEKNFKPCPSVREENKNIATKAIKRLTLPCLSSKDWLLLQEAWTLCGKLFDELDNRDCTYNTLSSLRFGQFPCLTTLDVHYCSQLRRLSREAMISQLLSSAKELEDYAKSAEYDCANFLTLLEPMIKCYGVPVVDLPTPKPLEEYPLDFEPPQVSCPPWGVKVMEALNRVAQRTTKANEESALSTRPSIVGSPSLDDSSRSTPFLDATQAVRMVYAAFMSQDDAEYGARLGRKNAQVMERLANMQSHQRAVLHAIQDVHSLSPVAARASDDFLIKAQLASNVGQPGHPQVLAKEIPMLTVRIGVGASLSGTCCITASQILIQTCYVPLVGGVKTVLLDLSKVQLQVHDSVAPSLLNPFPNTMSILVDREVIFSFRPSSLGPNRLLNFVTVLKGYQEEIATTGSGGPASEYSQPDQIVKAEEEKVDVAHLATQTDSDEAMPV